MNNIFGKGEISGWGTFLLDSAFMKDEIYTSHASFYLEHVGKVCLRILGVCHHLGTLLVQREIVTIAQLRLTRTSFERKCAMLDLTCGLTCLWT